jgi:hypothetical protein
MEHYTTPPYAFVACVGEIYIYLIVKILIEIQLPISRELHAAVLSYVYLNELQTRQAVQRRVHFTFVVMEQ